MGILRTRIEAIHDAVAVVIVHVFFGVEGGASTNAFQEFVGVLRTLFEAVKNRIAVGIRIGRATPAIAWNEFVGIIGALVVLFFDAINDAVVILIEIGMIASTEAGGRLLGIVGTKVDQG